MVNTRTFICPSRLVGITLQNLDIGQGSPLSADARHENPIEVVLFIEAQASTGHSAHTLCFSGQSGWPTFSLGREHFGRGNNTALYS
jgi:hypothetical protein